MRWFLLFLIIPFFAHALPMEQFAKLPISHEGRLKPVDSFARISFGDNAVEQLAKALFTPDEILDEPSFELPSPQLQQILQLPLQDAYSYNDLAPHFDAIRPALKLIANKDSNKFTATEKSLWGLYQQVQNFSQIIRSFTWAFSVEGSDKNYLELRSEREFLLAKVKKTIAQKGDDVARYNETEQQQAKLSLALASLTLIGAENNLFKVIPSTASELAAPWQVIEGGKGSPQSAQVMQQWQALALAYRADDEAQWNKQIEALSKPNWKINLEYLYNQLPLLAIIVGLYLLSLIPFRFAATAYGGGLLLHAIFILSRMAIMGRPPVSSLYESVLFVALACAAFGYWLYQRKQIKEAAYVGAALGAALLLISTVYAGQGDTFGVLIAVLNTNIWLATHVVCITLGYALSLLVGTMAHVALWRASVHRYLPFIAVLALLFTTIGTILGGIWADQSWGRFWGWDPKENGALLIVLWLAWLLHARMTVAVKERKFAALLAISNIIVALSWFGVNLLNTGLHSYGFTDNAALGLFWFCALEMALIVALYFYPQFVKPRA